MAKTTEVVAALGDFLKRKGIEANEATEPSTMHESQNPFGFWLTVCETGVIVNVSDAMHRKTLERNPWTTDVRGLRLETLSFRGNEVYRTVMRQIALFKKDKKANRCLVTTMSGRYFGHLYPINHFIPHTEHCENQRFVWILGGFNFDYCQVGEGVDFLEAAKQI